MLTKTFSNGGNKIVTSIYLGDLTVYCDLFHATLSIIHIEFDTSMGLWSQHAYNYFSTYTACMIWYGNHSNKVFIFKHQTQQFKRWNRFNIKTQFQYHGSFDKTQYLFNFNCHDTFHIEFHDTHKMQCRYIISMRFIKYKHAHNRVCINYRLVSELWVSFPDISIDTILLCTKHISKLHIKHFCMKSSATQWTLNYS